MERIYIKNFLKKLFVFVLVFVISVQTKAFILKADDNEIRIENNKQVLNLDNYTIDKTPEMIKKVIYKDNNKPIKISESGANNLNSVTVVNDDGTSTLHIFPYNIKYIDGNCVKFINNNIVKSNDNLYEYYSNQGSINKSFSKDFNKGIKLSSQNYYMKLMPINYTEILNNKKIGFNDEQHVDFIKNQNSITYDKIITDNIEIKYESVFNGIKQNIILSKYEGINKFYFMLDTNGLVPNVINGETTSIELLEPKTNKVIMNIGQIFAYDSSACKNISLNHTMYLKKTDVENQYILTLIIDKEFLENKNVTYPVEICSLPSVGFGKGYIQNTMVFEENPTERNWWSSIMFVGPHNIKGYGNCQMYVKLNSIDDFTYLSSSRINYVNFNILEWSGHTYPATIELYDTSSTWEYDKINYNNKPKVSGSRKSYNDYPPSDVWSKFDITTLFKAWLNNKLGEGGFSKDYGFCLKATNNTEHSRYYYSATDDSYPPTIDVNYYDDLPLPKSTYYIRNKYNGKFLDADISANDIVIAYPFKGEDNQKWELNNSAPYGFCQLLNLWFFGDRALGVSSDSGISDVTLYDSSTYPYNEKSYFRIIKNLDGTYRIMPMNGPNRALTCDKTDTEYTSICKFEPYVGEDNQKWIIEETPDQNMPSRTINMKVIIDKTYRNSYGSNYLQILKKDFDDNNYPFKNIFNITLNQTYYIDDKLPNNQCSNSIGSGCTNSCGDDCETQHHRGWGRGLAVLKKYYKTQDTPRELAVGITGTGFCYYNGEHSTAGGMAQLGGQYSIIPKPNLSYWIGIGSVRRQQHEISHLFGINHDIGTCSKNQRCIMNGGMDSTVFSKVADIWCLNCKQKIKNFVSEQW